MKRLISFILVVSILLTLAIPVVSADGITFNDLMVNGQKHWAYNTIMAIAEKKIIGGYPDGTYKPEENVLVDAYIKLAVVSLGYSFENGKDYWAMPFINKAKELKLIDGTEFNTYRRTITREEAAKIIVNALAIKEALPSDEQINKFITKVPDYSKITDKYKKYALYAYATGLIAGDERGYFNPKNNLSRAEAATVMMRLLDSSLRKPIDIDSEHANTIPELLKSDEEVWNRKDIRDLTSTGEYGSYELKGGKLYFSDYNNFSGVLPKETLNPDINRQIHDLMKVLIDDDHFVWATYTPETEADVTGYIGPSITHVLFSKSSGYAYNDVDFFTFRFADSRPFGIDDISSKFSKKASISLEVDSLWWGYKEDGSLYRPKIEGWVVPYYADKLKKSLIAIFGVDTGEKIYDYVYSNYMDERLKYLNSSEQRIKTTTIDNIQIDFHNSGAVLNFYFTFK